MTNARVFVIPAGNENALRIYVEATYPDQLDQLGRKAMARVSQFVEYEDPMEKLKKEEI